MYALHTNTDVRHQHLQGQRPTALGLILGSFASRETDVRFEYGERRWPVDDFAPTAMHIIFTTDGPRLARILKTVAHVVVGEDDGPVWEAWPIKQHTIYDTSWVFA